MPKPNIALVEARLQRGMSQQALARAIGVSLSTVARWEKGITRPFAYHQRKLVEFFHLAHEELGLVKSNEPVPPLAASLPPVPQGSLSLPASAESTGDEHSAIATSEPFLDEATRLALSRLALFPPKPQTFSVEPAMAMAGSTEKTLTLLKDAGVLEECPDERLCLRPITDYGKVSLPPLEEQRACERFLAWSRKALDVHQTDRAWMAKESQMILFALGMARDLNRHYEVCSLVLAFAPWMLEEGWLLIALDHVQCACDVARRQMPDLLPRLLFLLGQTFFQTGQYPEALATYQEGVYLARHRKESEQACRLLAAATWASLLYGEEAQAQRSLTEAWKLAEMNRLSDAPVAWLWALQGVLDWRGGDYIRAEAACSHSLHLFQRLPAKERTYACLPCCLLAMIEGNRGHYEQAEALFQEALSASESAGPQDFHIFIVGQRSLMHASTHPSKSLREELGAALLLARDRCAICYAHVLFRAIILVELALGKGSTAQPIAQQAFQLSRQSGAKNQQGESLLLLARITLAQKEMDQAERSLAQAWPLLQRYGTVEEQALAQEVRGELALTRGEPAAAQEAFREMARLAPLEHRALQALASYHLARCMAASGQKRTARRTGETSLKALEALGHVRAQEVREWLASLQPVWRRLHAPPRDVVFSRRQENLQVRRA